MLLNALFPKTVIPSCNVSVPLKPEPSKQPSLITETEYNILKFLTKNKGKVYSINQIYESVWEDEAYGAENIIAVHIRHIREKIESNPKEPKYLKVIWGIGYKIENIEN